MEEGGSLYGGGGGDWLQENLLRLAEDLVAHDLACDKSNDEFNVVVGPCHQIHIKGSDFRLGKDDLQ